MIKSTKNNLSKFIKYFKIIRLFLYKIRPGYKKYNVFDFLNKDSIFLDFGANIGEISLYVNDKFSCKIFCYEPHTGAFNQLIKKFKSYSNIELNNFAVSDITSEKYIYLHKNSSDEFDLEFSQATSLDVNKANIDINNKIKVKTVNITEIINRFQYIDCIKIDIEGHEYYIMPYLIENASMIGKVVCELHGHKKNKHLNEKYENLINILHEKKLYGDWFVEWE